MTTLVLTWACHPSSVVQNSFLGFNSCHLWDPQPREGFFFVVGVCVRACVRAFARVCACVPVCVFAGGGVGASEGRVISKFFTNWGGPNLFYSQPGEGHSFFGKENYFMSLSCLLFVNKNAKCIQT